MCPYSPPFSSQGVVRIASSYSLLGSGSHLSHVRSRHHKNALICDLHEKELAVVVDGVLKVDDGVLKFGCFFEPVLP
jgi:hypothetical protein